VSRLLVATTNAGKLAELTPLLAELGYEVCGLDAFPDLPAPDEVGETFAANAELKALAYSAATGLPSLADDSGLAVAALGGQPGVHSARFAGPTASDEENNALVLQRLTGLPDRRARFVCALCLAHGEQVLLSVEGRCEGVLLEAPRGDGGFGYDPLFVPDAAAAQGLSFAEMTSTQKSAISHRGIALALLKNTPFRRGGVTP
jgi:XTP/dITP diphosphohydrolase